MSEEKQLQPQEERERSALSHPLLIGGATFATAGIIDVVANLGPTGLVIGGIAAIIAARHAPDIIDQAKAFINPFADPGNQKPEQAEQQLALPAPAQRSKRSFLDRALGRFPADYQEDQDDQKELEAQPKEARPEANNEVDPVFQARSQEADNGITRLTVAQIVKHSERNTYRVWIGRSLTDPEHRAVQINFYKQHFRFMGASQRGKSSMVAAFLDIVTQTHDPAHVRLALLDLENQTSKLFAHLPHVATIQRGSQKIRLHARNEDEVLERLINVVEIMQYRYSLTKEKLLALPILLVYVEEFLALKNEFKSRVDRAKNKGQAEREKAISDYATLVYCIEQLAQRGLKARVQLLLCAHVEYADDDFREALVSVGCGFAFCVRPTAAQSAGFQNGELIRRNAKENKIGQAVVECPDCNDLILAPDYELEQRLLEFEKVHHSPDTSDIELEQAENQGVNVNAENVVNRSEKLVNASVNGREYSPTAVNVPQVSPQYSQAEEVQVLLAYGELQKAGRAVTRTGIRDHLKWDNKQYQRIIKPVCDKHNIAVAGA